MNLDENVPNQHLCKRSSPVPMDDLKKMYEKAIKQNEIRKKYIERIEEGRRRNIPLSVEYASNGFNQLHFEQLDLLSTESANTQTNQNLMNVSISSTSATDSIATGASASHYIANNHHLSFSSVASEFDEPMNTDNTIQTLSPEKEMHNATRTIPLKLSSSNPKLFTPERRQLQIVVEIDFAGKSSNAVGGNASESVESMLADALSGALSKVIEDNESTLNLPSEESSLLKSQSNRLKINLNKSNNQPFPSGRSNNRSFVRFPATQQVLDLPPNQIQSNFELSYANNVSQPTASINHDEFVQSFASKLPSASCTRNNLPTQTASGFPTNSLNANQTNNNLNSTMNNWQAHSLQPQPPPPTTNCYVQPNLNSNAYLFVDAAGQAHPLVTSQQLMNLILQQNAILLQQQQSILLLSQKMQCQIAAFDQNSTLNSNQNNGIPVNNCFFENTCQLPTGSVLPDNTRFVNNQPVAFNNLLSHPDAWIASNRLRQSQNDSMQASTPLLNSHLNNQLIYKGVGQQPINPTASSNRGQQFVDNFRSQSCQIQMNGSGKSNQSRTPQMTVSSLGSNSQNKMFFNSESNGHVSANSAVVDDVIPVSAFNSNVSSAANVSNSKLPDANSSKKSVNFSTRDSSSSQSSTPTPAQITLLYDMLKKLLDSMQCAEIVPVNKSTTIQMKSNESESFNGSAIGVEINLTDSLNKSVSSKSGRTKAASLPPLMSLPISNATLHNVSHAGDSALNDHSIVVGTQFSRPLVAADGQSCESEVVLPKVSQPVVLPNVTATISSSVVLNRSNPSPALSPVSSNGNHLFLTRPEVTGARRINLTPVTMSEQDSGTENEPRPEQEDEDEDDDEIDDEDSDQRTDLRIIKLKRQAAASLASLSTEQSDELKHKTQIVPSIATVNRVRLSGDGEQQSL